MTLSNKKIYIIAEGGVNHNGKLSLAKKLVKAAKYAGASAIKFQSFKAENLATKKSKKAPYQLKNTKNNENQFNMLKKLELKHKDYFEIKKYAKKLNIDFISSVFDEQSIDFLTKKIKNKIIKIPSGEINNIFILDKLNINSYKIILSTGMSNLNEIAEAINAICKSKVFTVIKNKIVILNKKKYSQLKKKISILHCVTDYPVEDKYANLNCIETLNNQFKIQTGYSDHTSGILAPLIAVSKGAKIIEKHLTLDKKMDGPDHLASLEPAEFKKMSSFLRKYEELSGNGKKTLQKCELKNIKIARRSLVAKVLIKKGEKFTKNNLTSKRPGTGINPMKINKIIKLKAKKIFLPDAIITI